MSWSWIRKSRRLWIPATSSTGASHSATNASGGTLTSTTQQTGKFTTLVAQLHLNPYQSITADAQATYGNVSHQIDQASFSANLVGTGRLADHYLGFTWFATSASWPSWLSG